MAPSESTPALQAALATLLTFAGQPMTVRELRDRAGLPMPLFTQALDELEHQGCVAWTDDDLVLSWPGAFNDSEQ